MVVDPSERLSDADVDRYLAHLGVPARASDRGAGGRPSADLGNLRLLQDLHLRAVPFENASVRRGEAIPLHPPQLVSKFVDRQRGGFCYELNGAFAALIVALGYRVERLGARVFNDKGGLGLPLDHLCLRVTVHGVPWLVDVGFGYSFREPLRFAVGPQQTDPSGVFRLMEVEAEPGSFDVESRHSDGVFHPQYRIGPTVHGLADFTEMCEYQRTSPDSAFVRAWTCARATATGFVTLADRELVISDGDQIVERRRLDDDEELAATIARWFGV